LQSVKRVDLGYPGVTRACVLLGVLIGILDVVGSVRCPVGGVVGNVFRSLAQMVAVAQLVPVAGLVFLRSPRPWERALKAAWILWLVVAFPIMLFGAYLALACLT
jgi:hypothetical protein